MLYAGLNDLWDIDPLKAIQADIVYYQMINLSKTWLCLPIIQSKGWKADLWNCIKSCCIVIGEGKCSYNVYKQGGWGGLNAFLWFIHHFKLIPVRLVFWPNNWMAFNTTFNSISVISRWQLTFFMSFLGFTSISQGLWSFLPKDTPTKYSQDPVRLELGTPGLQAKHFTNKPPRTPLWPKKPTYINTEWSFEKKINSLPDNPDF